MGSFEIQFRTLTPLWTGGVGGDCDRLHETGIIGSLRWWYEVVVRGLGGRACDPSDKEKACVLDCNRYKSLRREGKSLLEPGEGAALCHACQVFGTTGWQKLFKLEVKVDNKDGNTSLVPIVDDFTKKGLLLPSGRCPERDNKYRAGGWYILPARYGTFTLAFHLSPRCVNERYIQLFFATIRLMEHWAAIAAKETSGYGVFKITESQGIPPFPEENPFSSGGNNGSGLPDLTNFFFAKVRFRTEQGKWWQRFKEVELALDPNPPCHDKKQQRISEEQLGNWLNSKAFPLSHIVRNWFRYTWYLKLGFHNSEEVLYFGTEKGDRRRSAIGISHAYQLEDGLWEFRVWGYRPPGLEKKKWQQFVAKLFDALLVPGQKGGSPMYGGSLPSIWDKPDWKEDERDGCIWHRNEGGLFGGIVKPESLVWREFRSDRDTVGNFTDKWEFFKSLVEGRETGGA
ncbi:MAG: type III-B CRISPR module RAMP protein Cmr1 [Thermacetogeniaceae bacterium]